MTPPLEAHVCKAAPIRIEETPGWIIHITSELPDYQDLPSAERFYKEEASRLAEVLYLALPQGTFDRLVMELMAKKVSLYRGRTE